MKIVVIGVGGVGSWAAYCSAMYAHQNEIPCSLVLIDRDPIEEKNIARMAPVDRGYIGYDKVYAMNQLITNRIGSSNVTVSWHSVMFNENAIALLESANVVICATDTVATQRFVHQYCRKNEIKYIRAGYDGGTVNVTDQFPMTLEDDATEAADAGYHEIPVIFPAIVAGAMAAHNVWQEKGPRLLGPLMQLAVADSSLVPEKLVENWAKEHDFHQEDDCPACERSHCDNGDCDHSECISNNWYNIVDTAMEYHDNDNCESSCPYCANDTSKEKIEELEAKLAELEKNEEEPPSEDAPA